MESYTKEQEKMMLKLYVSLDEASKRRYAAIEALKLGHGGKKYIKELFGISYDSLSKGQEELEAEAELKEGERIRHVGGGRKAKKTMIR